MSQKKRHVRKASKTGAMIFQGEGMGLYVVWWKVVRGRLGEHPRYKEKVSVIKTQSMELEEEEEITEKILLKEKSKFTTNGCYFNSIPNHEAGFLSVENGDSKDFFQFPCLSFQSEYY